MCQNHRKYAHRITQIGQKIDLVAEACQGGKTRPHFCRYFTWSRSKSQMLSIFSVNTLTWLMLGEARWAYVVAILRDHAHFGDVRLSSGSRFSRYFSWSRSFWWFDVKLGKHLLSLFCHFQISMTSRFCRYFAWSRSSWWFDVKLGKHLLSLFCHFHISMTSRFCRYFAWSRSCWWFGRLRMVTWLQVPDISGCGWCCAGMPSGCGWCSLDEWCPKVCAPKYLGSRFCRYLLYRTRFRRYLLGYNPPKWTRIVAERDPKWPPNTRRAKDRGPVFCYSTNMTTNWCWKGSKMTAEYKKSKRPRSGILIFHQDEHEFVLKGIQHDRRIQEKQKTQVRYFAIPQKWIRIGAERDPR